MDNAKKEAMLVAKQVSSIDPKFKINTVFNYKGDWYVTEDLDDNVMDISCYKVGDELEFVSPYSETIDTDEFFQAMEDNGFDEYGNKKD